ncbi:MAG TPA: efflux RND transporter periplasmic adaptor subunit [Bryobacteraceae bacterium]|nr:efflux RND transporter periplasmic adaptor subunit [Bryobacteraceae bacterium]
MNRFILFSALMIAAWSAACSANHPESVSATAPQKLSVATAQATSRTVPASFEETGTFVADETSDIAPLVAGRVLTTPVNVGDFVKQGQVICELDHRDAELRLEQARAQMDEATSGMHQAESRIGLRGDSQFDPNRVPEVAAARANYESAQAQAKLAAADARRYENLVASGDVSRSAFDKAHTQQETADAQANAARQQYEAALNGARQGFGAVESAQAALAAARAQLEQAEKGLADTTIRAPFDGNITARPVAAGEYVGMNNKIATIVRIGSLKLQLQTPEQRASQAKLGMAVEARVAAYPDRVFTGKVTAIDASVDPASRVFIVEARFDNAGSQLRPGMFAKARVLLPGGETAVFVPRSAVLRDKTTDSNQVYFIDNGKARLRVVVLGDAEGDQIRIASGLAGTETVAVSRLSELYDGALVEARN